MRKVASRGGAFCPGPIIAADVARRHAAWPLKSSRVGAAGWARSSARDTTRSHRRHQVLPPGWPLTRIFANARGEARHPALNHPSICTLTTSAGTTAARFVLEFLEAGRSRASDSRCPTARRALRDRDADHAPDWRIVRHRIPISPETCCADRRRSHHKTARLRRKTRLGCGVRSASPLASDADCSGDDSYVQSCFEQIGQEADAHDISPSARCCSRW
jgi:hypothetical protein